MDSWWELGESFGRQGTDLDKYWITCPFCMERGNFGVAYHAEKAKPNGRKKLNFDVLECGSCKGYVMCLWSAGERTHDYRVLPWPLRIERHPEEWPDHVGRYWVQAHRSLADENWDAAAVMARSALQAALREQGAAGANLQREINDLASKGLLPPTMREWADALRVLANESAHPRPDDAPTRPQDAKDIVRFLDFLLKYLYTLPHQIEEYRARSGS
jgi:hypothetical protein